MKKQMSESLLIGTLLAVSGGLMDAYSYLFRGQVFANAQTGNILLLSVHLAQQEWRLALQYACPVIAFSIGIAWATITRHISKQSGWLHWRQICVLFEAAVLFSVAWFPRSMNLFANSLISLACGTQVEAFRKTESTSVATTMCIGNLRSAIHSTVTHLKYVAPEDIHVYSIDEVFLDATAYLQYNNVTARGFAKMIVQDVLATTGITATAGIGTNLYLCKVAMDIVAKHIEPDADGVRIAKLNERSYRHLLWDHRPLTDFWRVGHGYARKLEANGIFTMGDVARCSINRESLLYKLFGVNAELLIDHAWGWEPCTIKDIKEYKPSSNSVSSGQVLHCPYTWQKARLIVREMTDALVLDLVDKGLVTDQIVLTIGYDIENLSDPARARSYQGVVTVDHYGRSVPKHAHGTANLGRYTSSTKLIMKEVLALYDRITDPSLLVRRVTLGANHVLDESLSKRDEAFEQVDLFCDYEVLRKQREQEQFVLERERRRQQVILDIKKKYGKNAILKGTSLEEGATARDRNRQIGGHRE